MIREILISLGLTVVIVVGAQAQFMQKLPASSAAAASYTGPGDVVSGATRWFGLRAYNAAKRGSAVANVCNPSDATCADVLSDATTGAVTNAPVIGGVTCDNASNKCSVKTLYDQTATGDNLANGTEANRPVWYVSAVGSKPCMYFNGSQRLVNFSVSSISQPDTVSFVANRTGGSAAQNHVMNSGQVTYFPATSNLVGMYAGAVLTATANESTFHAVQQVFNGASSVLYVDGSATNGDASTAATSTGENMGADASDGQRLTGYICEAGRWPSGFNSTQQSNVNSNQHTFWGF